MQQERNRGGENLVFTNAQEAAEFRESVESNIMNNSVAGTHRPREILAEELAKKFAEHGVGVSSLHTPWEHSQEEHHEVQDLVNVAFADTLPAALRRAENSPLFPRNIDLFHDVLTGELYDAVVGQRLDTMHVSVFATIALVLPILLLIIAILLFVYSI